MPPVTLEFVMTASYEMHELCTVFPLMNNEQFMVLVKDIRENGLLEPITLFEGKILDGRSRYTACVNAMIKPHFVEFGGDYDQAVKFVVSRNISRRHLSDSQRAMVAGKIANLKNGEREIDKAGSGEPGISIDSAAQKLDVSRESVKRARKVLKTGIKELAEAVEKDEIPVRMASEIADLDDDIQHEILSSEAPKQSAKHHLAFIKHSSSPANRDDRKLRALHKAWDAADSDARARFLENIGVTSFVGIEL